VLPPKFAAEDAAKMEESDIDVPKVSSQGQNAAQAVGDASPGDISLPIKLELKDLDCGGWNFSLPSSAESPPV
jgi:hypothetical protein